jgi:hypothetical protein
LPGRKHVFVHSRRQFHLFDFDEFVSGMGLSDVPWTTHNV